jgi:hypothetical protein
MAMNFSIIMLLKLYMLLLIFLVIVVFPVLSAAAVTAGDYYEPSDGTLSKRDNNTFQDISSPVEVNDMYEVSFSIHNK